MISAICIVLLFLICFFLIVMCYDCNRFVTVEYEIKSDKITEEYMFVLLSDLHNKSFGSGNEVLLSEIGRLAPDAVLVAGDMLTASGNRKKSKRTMEFMAKLAGKYPVYYGMGNHEQRIGECPDEFGDLYDVYLKSLNDSGIWPLINENVTLPSANINVCGLQMDRSFYRKFRKLPMSDTYLRDLLGEPKQKQFQILIAHNPDYFEEYAMWGADLVVSGHVHGGLMRLPVLGGVVSPKLTFFPKYDGGRFEENGAVMILSRGLGTHTLPIRIFNPGELIVLRLKPAKS